MDNMEKEFLKVIEALRALDYSDEQINYGINKLDNDAYPEWNTRVIIADIIKNIEQGESND